MNPYDYDSDSEEDVPGISTSEITDRSERVRQMMIQASSAQASLQNVLQDDQVTDFVLRMHQKNQDMMERNTTGSSRSVPHHQQPRFVISDDEESSEEGDELDASFQRKQYRKRFPDEYPPGEAYAGDEGELDSDMSDIMDDDPYAHMESYDPKEDGDLSWARLCCVACGIVIAMIAATILILVFVILADDEVNGTTTHHNTHHGSDGMMIPFAPSNLGILCSVDALQTMQGELQCRDPCMKAACCWEKGENNGGDPVCFDSHPLECAPYDTCNNLLTAGSNAKPYTVGNSNSNRPTSRIPVAPEGVQSCDPAVIDSVAGLLACEDSCNLGACCWRTDEFVDECPTDPNCDGYKPCQILNINSGSGSGSGSTTTTATTTNTPAPAPSTPPPVYIPPAPQQLAAACDPSPVGMGDAIDACIEYCDAAKCCWLTTTTTQGDVTESVPGTCAHQPECEGYKSCGILDVDVYSPAAVTPAPVPATTPAPAPTVEITEDMIIDVCYNHENQPGGPDLCQEACEPGLCCFQAGGCTDDPSLDCTKYEPCGKLVQNTDGTTEPSELQLACGDDSSDFSDCIHLCSAGTCCFTTDPAKMCNVAAPGTICSDYEPCERIFKSAQNNGSTRRTYLR